MLSIQIDDIAIGVDVNYIIPDGYDDAGFLAVRDYARTHHAQLIRNAYSN